MKHLPLALIALSFAVPAQADDLSESADRALAEDTLAWDFVEGITTEVGPRQAGTEAEARGRVWAMDWLRAQGFARVADLTGAMVNEKLDETYAAASKPIGQGHGTYKPVAAE